MNPFAHGGRRLHTPASHGRQTFAKRSQRLGAYTVEFAVCIPVLLSTVFGALELARYVYIRQSLDQTAYEAARQGVLAGSTVASVEDHAQQLLSAYGVRSAEVTVTPALIDRSTTEVTVTINCNYGDNSWVTPGSFTAANLQTQITLDHENQAYLVPAEASEADELNENDEPQDV